MLLVTEEMGDTPDVTAADIDSILPTDCFGKFAILSASESSFIQAGNDWQPGEECASFLKTYQSDPWVLEFRDGGSGKQFRTQKHVTLEQVRAAFQSYLAGGNDWQRAYPWSEIEL